MEQALRPKVTIVDGGTLVRLGWVECAILEQVHARGGMAPRSAIVDLVFPRLGRRPPDSRRAAGERRLAEWMTRRAHAESAISRSIRTLVAKDLLTLETDGCRGLKLLRAAGSQPPAWERVARREDELSARCRRLADEFRWLASRADGRAAAIRGGGSDAGTATEREADVEHLRRLMKDDLALDGGR